MKANAGRSRRNLSRNCQGILLFEMDVDNHKTLSTKLYVHNAITTFTNNQLSHNDLFGLKILVNAYNRFSCIFVSKSHPLMTTNIWIDTRWQFFRFWRTVSPRPTHESLLCQRYGRSTFLRFHVRKCSTTAETTYVPGSFHLHTDCCHHAESNFQHAQDGEQLLSPCVLHGTVVGHDDRELWIFVLSSVKWIVCGFGLTA